MKKQTGEGEEMYIEKSDEGEESGGWAAGSEGDEVRSGDDGQEEGSDEEIESETTDADREKEAISEEQTDVLGDEGEKSVKDREHEMERKIETILVLDDETPVDEREGRRSSRMARKLEVKLAAKRSRGHRTFSSEEKKEDEVGEEIPVTKETTDTTEAEEAAGTQA